MLCHLHVSKDETKMYCAVLSNLGVIPYVCNKILFASRSDIEKTV